MPVVFREHGYRFFFCSNEGSPREPVHIHVEKDDIRAKFWLIPKFARPIMTVTAPRTLRELLEIVEANREDIERAWYGFFGD